MIHLIQKHNLMAVSKNESHNLAVNSSENLEWFLENSSPQ
jgi:hypothetical protein